MKKNELVCIETTKSPTHDELPYIFVKKFDEEAVINFYKDFLKLSSKPEIKVVPIVISSYGGEVYSLLAMIDIIKSSQKPVSTIALGKAMSCGAVLLAAGTKGYRYSAPHTDIMIHEVSSLEWGKTTNLENGTKQVKRLNKTLFDMLTEMSSLEDKNFLMKELKAKGNIDWFLSSKDFKKMGLVDHVSVPSLVKG